MSARKPAPAGEETAAPKARGGRPRLASKGPVVSLGWGAEDWRESDRRNAARAIVAVLLGLPQPAADAPAALQGGPRPEGGPDFAQGEVPLSYTEVGERFSFAGWRDYGGALCRTPSPRKPAPDTAFAAAKRKARQLSPDLANPRRDSPPGRPVSRERPGKGGRRPRTTMFTETTATAEVRAELGEPREFRRGGVTTLIWEMPDGDGLQLARLSGRDIQGGETLMGQLHPIRRTCRDLDRRPRFVVATLSNSGGRRFDHRPDLLFLEEQLKAGEINWVAVRDLDRFFRRDSTKAQTFELLEDTDTELIIASWGRSIDWQSDKLALHALAMVGEKEREMIAERTQSAIVNQFVAEGRGHVGSPPFGFWRNPMTREIEVDLVQWPFVKMIHYGYDEIDGGRGSLRTLAEKLSAAGCPFSHSHLKNILGDLIYVTGERTTSLRGRPITCKPVPLDDPIPLDVYQRNLERLALNKARHSATERGRYAFNLVPVFHARCQHLQVPNGKGKTTTPRLKVRTYGKRDFVEAYKHAPRVPDCCRGWQVDAADFEPPIMRALLRLAGCRTLQQEWATAARPEAAEATPVMKPAERRELEQQIRALKSKKEELESATARRLIDEEIDQVARAWTELVAPLQREIEKLERRIQIAESMPVRRRRAPFADDPVLKEIADAGGVDEDAEPDLLLALRELLTEEIPEDTGHIRRRAAVIQACLSKVVVHDVDGGIAIELFGPLTPEGTFVSPLASARPQLEAHLRDRAGAGAGDGAGDAVGDAGSLHVPSSKGVLVARHVQSDAGAAEPLPYREFVALFYSADGRRLFRRSRAAARDAEAVERKPAWRSPIMAVSASTHTGLRKPGSRDRCEWGLREARSELDRAELLTQRAYRAVNARRPELPSYSTVSAYANTLGISFGALRRLVLGPDPAPPAGYERAAALKSLISDAALVGLARAGDVAATRRGRFVFYRVVDVERSLAAGAPPAGHRPLTGLVAPGRLSSLRRAIRSGRLRGVMVSGCWWVRPEDLDELLADAPAGWEPVSALADLLSPQALYRAIRRERIEAMRRCGRTYLRRSDVEAYLAQPLRGRPPRLSAGERP